MSVPEVSKPNHVGSMSRWSRFQAPPLIEEDPWESYNSRGILRVCAPDLSRSSIGSCRAALGLRREREASIRRIRGVSAVGWPSGGGRGRVVSAPESKINASGEGIEVQRDLGRFHVDRLIVHDVPKRSPSDPTHEPNLSDVESPADQDIKNYFRERIIKSLGTAAYHVVPDGASTSPVPEAVFALLADDYADFVPHSQLMARHLFESQNKINSPGLLVVAAGRIEGRRSLGLMKLEREQGVRVEEEHLNGGITFNIEHVRDLMLTDTTKVFKVGVFVLEGQGVADLEGIVSDKQRGYQPRTEIADFFLARFLGCKLEEQAEVTTKRFFVAAQDYINDEVTDPEHKARYQLALLAELGSNRATLRVAAFAGDHFSDNDRAAFLNRMEEEGVPRVIDKDTTRIRSQLQRIQIDFESGILVISPYDVFDEHVAIEVLDGGETRVLIQDRLNRVKGRGRG